MRHQLPVSSPVTLSSLVRAAGTAFTRRESPRTQLAQSLCARFGASAALLTDSGTSALVLALLATAGVGGTVAYPSYACIDLAAAAIYAGVRVRLYDLDPDTLSADLDSLAATLDRGVDAVVAAHLYGYATDVPAMARLASRYGVSVIEDAAQAAGGELHGRYLGSFGPLTVLSFGRGKGITGGHGGALLATTREWAERLNAITPPLASPDAGWRDLLSATAQWAFGRPSLYGIPAAIPALRLGEMVYHPAHAPAPLSHAAATLVTSALTLESCERARRHANVAALRPIIEAAPGVTPIRGLDGSEPGYLRLPIRVRDARSQVPAIGAMRGYPRALFEQPELHSCLHDNECAPPNGAALRASVFTLPVHGFVRAEDRARLGAWLGAPSHTRAPTNF